jgi:hypothetical protein
MISFCKDFPIKLKNGAVSFCVQHFSNVQFLLVIFSTTVFHNIHIRLVCSLLIFLPSGSRCLLSFGKSNDCIWNVLQFKRHVAETSLKRDATFQPSKVLHKIELPSFCTNQNQNCYFYFAFHLLHLLLFCV